MPKLEPHSRKLSYSYALGVFPSLMLMEACPERVQRLLFHPDGMKNEGVEKLYAICARRGIREEVAERVLRRESGKDSCYSQVLFSMKLAPMGKRNSTNAERNSFAVKYLPIRGIFTMIEKAIAHPQNISLPHQCGVPQLRQKRYLSVIFRSQ